MAKKFGELRAKMSPERRARNEARAGELLAEMPLQELRRAMDLSQERVAEILGLRQSSVSKIENEADMYVSTLRSYIEALGGSLVVTAKMPAGEVVIQNFDDIRRKTEDRESVVKAAVSRDSR
jgi:transcriptional regulator with XRE-family HTH domain